VHISRVAYLTLLHVCERISYEKRDTSLHNVREDSSVSRGAR